jgi:chromosome partitioning protein
MIITVASYKGGVGKTTTALHLAAFFQRLAPTLLVDGDAIRTSIKWSQRGDGKGLPFTVVDEKQTAIATRDGHFQHVIMDTEANPSIADFQEVAKGCDLLVIPAVPETVATDGLTHTLSKLHELGSCGPRSYTMLSRYLWPRFPAWRPLIKPPLPVSPCMPPMTAAPPVPGRHTKP